MWKILFWIRIFEKTYPNNPLRPQRSYMNVNLVAKHFLMHLSWRNRNISKQFNIYLQWWNKWLGSKLLFCYDLLPEIELCKNNSFKKMADFYFTSDTFWLFNKWKSKFCLIMAFEIPNKNRKKGIGMWYTCMVMCSSILKCI